MPCASVWRPNQPPRSQGSTGDGPPSPQLAWPASLSLTLSLCGSPSLSFFLSLPRSVLLTNTTLAILVRRFLLLSSAQPKPPPLFPSHPHITTHTPPLAVASTILLIFFPSLFSLLVSVVSPDIAIFGNQAFASSLLASSFLYNFSCRYAYFSSSDPRRHFAVQKSTEPHLLSNTLDPPR